MESQEFDLLMGRFNDLDEKITQQQGMCQKLCLTKIDNIETIANKAHTRLDRHKTTLDELCNWQNQMKGRMWVASFIFAPIIAAITAGIVSLLIRIMVK